MLEKEPLWFPSRNLLPYNPGISDRQLWAIGMIVVQWSMTETIIEQSTHFLIENDETIRDEYRKLRNFQQRLDFWQKHRLNSGKATLCAPMPSHYCLD